MFSSFDTLKTGNTGGVNFKWSQSLSYVTNINVKEEHRFRN